MIQPKLNETVRWDVHGWMVTSGFSLSSREIREAPTNLGCQPKESMGDRMLVTALSWIKGQ
jgi:hypothetical protein